MSILNAIAFVLCISMLAIQIFKYYFQLIVLPPSNLQSTLKTSHQPITPLPSYQSTSRSSHWVLLQPIIFTCALQKRTGRTFWESLYSSSALIVLKVVQLLVYEAEPNAASQCRGPKDAFNYMLRLFLLFLSLAQAPFPHLTSPMSLSWLLLQ